MFKSVEYVGFEGRPDLKTKAEQLTPVLASEINTWRDKVEVRWSPCAGDGILDLTLALTLPNGVSARQSGTVTAEDFSRNTWLASRCRRVWSDLLGILLDKQHQRVEDFILSPAEI